MGDDSAAIATMNAASSVMYIQYGNDTNWSQSVNHTWMQFIHTAVHSGLNICRIRCRMILNAPSWFQNYYFWIYRDQNTGEGKL